MDAFVSRLSFTSLVERTLEEVLGTSAKTAFIKNADSDVAKIKKFLRIRLGTTYVLPSQFPARQIRWISIWWSLAQVRILGVCSPTCPGSVGRVLYQIFFLLFVP